MSKNIRKQKAQNIAAEKLQEYLKCKNDFKYFFENYVILELAGADTTVKLYNKQEDLCNLIDQDKFVVVLKSRQTGISTVIQGYCAHALTFFDNVHVGIISKDGDEATAFARFIAGILEKLPPWMRPGFKKKTEQTFILKNGSKVYSSTVNPVQPDKTLRGKVLHILVIDEAAFCRNIDDAWTGLVPTLSTAQKAARKVGNPYATIVISTPAKVVGTGAWYYQTYTRAMAGDDIFKPFIIHWKEIPELANDPEWYSNQCKLWGNDEKKIAQELDLKFGASDDSFLLEKTIRHLQDHKIEPIEKYKMFNGEIWVFEKPNPDKTYMIGVDAASEHGHDKLTIVVIDYETMEQVWEFRGKCKVKELTSLVMSVATQYPGAIVVENNSYGNQVVEELECTDFYQYLYKEKISENKLQAGIKTTPRSRPLMINSLYSCVTDFPDIVKSERMKMELIGLEYSKNKDRIEAGKGCYDDLAMAYAFCLYVRMYDPPLMHNTKLLRDSYLTRALELNDDRTLRNYNQDEIKEAILNNPDEYSGVVDILKMITG